MLGHKRNISYFSFQLKSTLTLFQSPKIDANDFHDDENDTKMLSWEAHGLPMTK